MSDKIEKTCPKCGGASMWDNRQTKRNPKAPDYKCTRRECDGAVWEKPKDSATEKPAYVQQDRGSLPNDEPTPTVKSTQMYLDAMKFVVDKVVPIWEAGKVPYTAGDINAATATVMIDHQRRSGR